MSLITTQEAAEYLGVSRYFLERDRVEGPNIPVIYVGQRSPRYRVQDLDRFIRSKSSHNPDDSEEDDEWDHGIPLELDEHEDVADELG